MIIRKAEVNDIDSILILLSQVLEIHASIRPDIFVSGSTKYSKEDIITTITEFTVLSIVYNYKIFIKDFDEVIVSGGGSHNEYIMDRLNEELDNKVHTLDDLYDKAEFSFSDAKEAFAFAVLGYLSLNGRTGNVKASTGANDSLVLGEVTLARKV